VLEVVVDGMHRHIRQIASFAIPMGGREGGSTKRRDHAREGMVGCFRAGRTCARTRTHTHTHNAKEEKFRA
jgi:hypothetical protein